MSKGPLKQFLRRTLRPLLPRTVKQHRILQGPIRGKSIVTSWHDYPAAILGRTERPLLDWFALNVGTGETWLDIGAHYGYTSLALCRLVGGQGRVYAFEPVLCTAGHLDETRSANSLENLFVIPFGLTSGNGIRLERLPTTRGMAFKGSNSGSEVQSMLLTSFDDFWPGVSLGRQAIHGVKIDVQGMEIDVLRGMAGVLRQFHPKLVVEVHAGVDRAELIDLIRELGYDGAAKPIEPQPGEVQAAFFDDCSYFFPLIS